MDRRSEFCQTRSGGAIAELDGGLQAQHFSRETSCRPGALGKRGYIIGPFATVEIDGFRRSFDEVATFRFGAVHKSYAAQKGDDRNVGVIGVAFFEEAGTNFDWTSFEIDRRHDADPFPGRFASPPIRRF